MNILLVKYMKLNINYILKKIEAIQIGGSVLNNPGIITSVAIDSRVVSKDALYIAIKGINFDGNDFIDDVLKEEVGLIITSCKDTFAKYIDRNIILVNDEIQTLGELAKHYLNTLDIKVIGVTGSVGKTSTKDLIAGILSSKYKVFKTDGNKNNHIGLPLTIFSADSSYDVIVLEMGMSNFNEIEYLVNIANPDIGVITNIGMSHIEQLGSKEGILKAKMEITSNFSKDNILILNGDDTFLSRVESDEYKVLKVGFNNNNNFKASVDSNGELSITDGYYHQTIATRFNEEHSIRNFMLAIGVANEMGCCLSEIVKGLEYVQHSPMRMEKIKKGKSIIFNDCYNASPDSMKAAIRSCYSLNKKRNYFVLGDMLELGTFTKEAHNTVANFVMEQGNGIVLTFGKFSKHYHEILNDRCITFDDKDAMGEYIRDLVGDSCTILIKASRGARYEEVFNKLL